MMSSCDDGWKQIDPSEASFGGKSLEHDVTLIRSENQVKYKQSELKKHEQSELNKQLKNLG